MATRLRSTQTCAVCGCDDVILDYILQENILEANVLEEEVAGRQRAFALALAECPRCEHRWTRSLRLSTRREAQQAAVVRVLRTASEAVPTAA